MANLKQGSLNAEGLGEGRGTGRLCEGTQPQAKHKQTNKQEKNQKEETNETGEKHNSRKKKSPATGGLQQTKGPYCCVCVCCTKKKKKTKKPTGVCFPFLCLFQHTMEATKQQPKCKEEGWWEVIDEKKKKNHEGGARTRKRQSKVCVLEEEHTHNASLEANFIKNLQMISSRAENTDTHCVKQHKTQPPPTFQNRRSECERGS